MLSLRSFERFAKADFLVNNFIMLYRFCNVTFFSLVLLPINVPLLKKGLSGLRIKFVATHLMSSLSYLNSDSVMYLYP